MQEKPSHYKIKSSINNIEQFINKVDKVKTSNKQDYDRIE